MRRLLTVDRRISAGAPKPAAPVSILPVSEGAITVTTPAGLVVDLITAEERGTHCDHCSDPIDRGELVAVLSNGERVHDDGCRPSTDADSIREGRE